VSTFRQGPCRVLSRVVGHSVTTTALAEALHRDAAALLEAYQAGTWAPASEERELAEGLARSGWSDVLFRAALRDAPPAVRSGRLIDVLEPAITVLKQAAAEDTVLQLRLLVDALTAVQ
jgi:hypothetical protein